MHSIFEYEHPFVCTDAVVFTIKTQEADSYRKLAETSLQVLLYKREEAPFANCWCLPGGFLNIDEMPEANIRRKISEKAQIEGFALEQLCTFCDLHRDPRGRVISIAYLGLIEETQAKAFAKDENWFQVFPQESGQIFLQKEGQTLAAEAFGFDHHQILQSAIERLRSKIVYSDIIFHLLPKEFTLTQLQNVYEAIMGKKELAANFRRKIAHMVVETGDSTSDKGHRPAKVYRKA